MHRARLRAENQGQPDMSVLVWRGWWYRVAWRCFASGAETWVFLFLYLPIQRARMRTCFETTWGQNLRKCLQVCAGRCGTRRGNSWPEQIFGPCACPCEPARQPRVPSLTTHTHPQSAQTHVASALPRAGVRVAC